MFAQEKLGPPQNDYNTHSSQVTAPTALYAGDNDALADLADIQMLAEVLPNLIAFEVVDYEGWTHADFFMATRSGELVTSRYMQLMEQYN